MAERDVGQAFPGTYREDNGRGGSFLVQRGGMTLRDYFAGQALTGLLASDSDAPATPYYYAAKAYEYADAMLAASRPERGEAR